MVTLFLVKSLAVCFKSESQEEKLKGSWKRKLPSLHLGQKKKLQVGTRFSASRITWNPHLHSADDVSATACNVGDLGSIPGLGRSPGEGKGYPIQYSGLENSMDCTVHGAAKRWT